METFRQEIAASLEGMKVVVANNRCELYEYNFKTDTWSLVEETSRPMPRSDAERWVQNWNPVDRTAALAALSSAPVDVLCQEIVASLEGMKVVVASNRCELYEYNFKTDTWLQLEKTSHPMLRGDAERWVQNWNPVDQTAALAALSSAPVDVLCQEIVASLEGMKVVVASNRCELYEYNFKTDTWLQLEKTSHPMLRGDAERWVRNWNPVDRSIALAALGSAATQ